MEHWEKKVKGSVFISHSSYDYEDVKIVRNYLEESDFSALMFYLKSLEDPSKHSLTQKLIKWEIKERNIFVVCNSESAKASKWVQEEISYVKHFPEKIYVEIDMEKLKHEKCTQLSKLDNLIQSATLFLLYAYQDKRKVDKIDTLLSSSGFRTFKDKSSIKLGNDIENKINQAIKETINKGAVLIFLSKNAKQSKWFWRDKRIALEKKALIIPILLDQSSIYEFSAFENFKTSHYINASNGFNEKEKNKLITLINNETLEL